MNNCTFCKIANRELDATIIHEDEKHMAFLDINPISQGHTLVIPKKHYKDITDIPPKEWGELTQFTQKIAKVIKETMNADGINTLQNTGSAAGQIIFHVHVHIVPRKEMDEINFRCPRKKYGPEQMKQIGKLIRDKLD